MLYLSDEARYDHLLNQPENADFGRVLNHAMTAIEDHNPALKGVLPKVYGTLPNDVLVELLRTINSLAADIEGDGFGLVYEYFLGQFAMAEGQGGGEFFTPTSIVRLIVDDPGTRSTARSTTRPAARAACSCSPPPSWPATRKTRAGRCPSTARSPRAGRCRWPR